MASEITNKFSGQVMRVYFTVFSLDSLSLSLRLNFQTIIRSKVQLVISLSIGTKISKKRRNPDIPVTKTRLHVSALSMQWNLNVAIVFETSWLLFHVQPDSRRTGNSNFSCRAICSPIIIPRPPLSRCTQGVNFYYDFQLPIRLVPLNPSPSPSLSFSLCLLLFLSYHRNSRLACFTRLLSANNARSFVDLSN